VCVGRHRYLSEHLARVFCRFGCDAVAVVGVVEAAGVAASVAQALDAVLCDYDILVALSAEEWREIPLLCAGRVIAVSLNRRADELPLLGLRGASGFLYLPLVTRETALAAIKHD
jgi:hypothetical protein